MERCASNTNLRVGLCNFPQYCLYSFALTFIQDSKHLINPTDKHPARDNCCLDETVKIANTPESELTYDDNS